ncbi:Heterogeneous nuclear ribonucleoprotein U-like protein 1 [Eumeta japonica]|uniref:Heterogeneous nuclear ribonucleoprotein U-like protein 1 n=1 Tax=Eumeta variegata TaxID=151549 RepID=A0A4C2AAP8_EUMVA|nr:Heterogeneous nuclear ribonucleoprotein U-like protein 1 [Eumeta japonica]
MDPAKMKVVDLRSELSALGLDTKGNKPALVERLKKALEAKSGKALADTTILDTSTEETTDEVSTPQKPGPRTRRRSSSIKTTATPAKVLHQEEPKQIPEEEPEETEKGEQVQEIYSSEESNSQDCVVTEREAGKSTSGQQEEEVQCLDDQSKAPPIVVEDAEVEKAKETVEPMETNEDEDTKKKEAEPESQPDKPKTDDDKVVNIKEEVKEEEERPRHLTEEEEWEQLNERLLQREHERKEKEKRLAEEDAKKLEEIKNDPIKLQRYQRKQEKKARWSNFYRTVEAANEVLAPIVQETTDKKREPSPAKKIVEPELNDDKITLSWYDSDLNQYLELPDLTSVTPFSEGAFAHTWAGTRASHGITSGRVCYEVKMGALVTTTEDNATSGLRIGWSTDDSTLHLGEGKFSWGYESTGRIVHNGEFKEYGKTLNEKDVIGVYLDLESNPCKILYTVNGEEQGVAFEFSKSELEGRTLFPHMLTKNICYRVNFGNDKYNMLTKTHIVRRRIEIPVEKVLEEKKAREAEIQKQRDEAKRRDRERHEQIRREKEERSKKKREDDEKRKQEREKSQQAPTETKESEPENQGAKDGADNATNEKEKPKVSNVCLKTILVTSYLIIVEVHGLPIMQADPNFICDLFSISFAMWKNGDTKMDQDEQSDTSKVETMETDQSQSNDKSQETSDIKKEAVEESTSKEMGEKISDVGKRFGFSRSTVSTIWKNKEKILQTESEGKSSKKLKKPKYEDLDQAILSWFHRQRQNNMPISGPLVKAKAENFAEELGLAAFKASEGWLGKFKQRHHINYGKISGEARVLQPMDQSVIKSLKGHYRRKLLMELVQSEGKTSVNMLHAVNFCLKPGKSDTCQHSFRHAGLCTNSTSDVETEPEFDSDDDLPLTEWIHQHGQKYDTTPSEVTEEQVFHGVQLDPRIKFVVRYEVTEELSGQEACLTPGYVFIVQMNLEPGPRRPTRNADCEVILMVGLPGAGKTHWARNHAANHPERRYNIISTGALFDKMKVDCKPFRSTYEGRWDAMVSKCAKCVLKMLEVSQGRRRNFILDQTNVYPSAQRRKLREFEGYRRVAVVVVPDEATYEERHKKREQADGKEVPDGAILDMKANFALPEKCSWIEDVVYAELQHDEAKAIIDKFHKDAKVAGVQRDKEKRERSPVREAPPSKRPRPEERRGPPPRESRPPRDFGPRDREDRWGGGGGGGGGGGMGGGSRWGGGGGMGGGARGPRDPSARWDRQPPPRPFDRPPRYPILTQEAGNALVNPLGGRIYGRRRLLTLVARKIACTWKMF